MKHSKEIESIDIIDEMHINLKPSKILSVIVQATIKVERYLDSYNENGPFPSKEFYSLDHDKTEIMDLSITDHRNNVITEKIRTKYRSEFERIEKELINDVNGFI